MQKQAHRIEPQPANYPPNVIQFPDKRDVRLNFVQRQSAAPELAMVGCAVLALAVLGALILKVF